KRARERRAGLRVFVGHSTAIVSTADLSALGLADLARDACSLAQATAPDPFAGLPDAGDLATEQPDLGLYDPASETLEADAGLALARAAEAAALAAAPEIDNSDGADFGGGGGQIAYASSLGFAGTYSGSSFSLSVTPVARRNGSMQRDSWYTFNRHLAALDDPSSVGREAARRPLRRLRARRRPPPPRPRAVRPAACPVVCDPDTAASLLRHLASAISGTTLYRRSSFLLDRLGERIAAPVVTVIDDPLRAGGAASRPFDAEGVASRRRTV